MQRHLVEHRLHVVWELRVQRGIEELYRAYTGAGLTDSKFLGPTYYRLKTVKLLQDRGLLTDDLRWR